MYTLVLHPNQTYVVSIDNVEKERGQLEDDWDFLPPKKIQDPKAEKPKDWQGSGIFF
jgi:calreticulin